MWHLQSKGPFNVCRSIAIVDRHVNSRRSCCNNLISSTQLRCTFNTTLSFSNRLDGLFATFNHPSIVLRSLAFILQLRSFSVQTSSNDIGRSFSRSQHLLRHAVKQPASYKDSISLLSSAISCAKGLPLGSSLCFLLRIFARSKSMNVASARSESHNMLRSATSW